MYNKLLVALDLSESATRVLDRAMGFAAGDSSRIEVVHVVESIPSAYGTETFAIDLNQLHDQLLAQSRRELIARAQVHNIAEASLHTVSGNPAKEIRRLAKELDADAIVIGSHGRSGWELVLGSTANRVLHGAKCDVLTVYVED